MTKRYVVSSRMGRRTGRWFMPAGVGEGSRDPSQRAELSIEVACVCLASTFSAHRNYRVAGAVLFFAEKTPGTRGGVPSSSSLREHYGLKRAVCLAPGHSPAQGILRVTHNRVSPCERISPVPDRRIGPAEATIGH